MDKPIFNITIFIKIEKCLEIKASKHFTYKQIWCDS